LSGKLLSVFMTVSVQVTTLLIAGHYIFSIYWGEALSVGVAAAGIIFSASSFGIFVNSLLKDTKQGAVIFGGVLTVTGMLGMINTFGMGGSAGGVGDVSLLVPQGWGVRSLTQAMNGDPIADIAITVSILLVWSAIFFIIGVWRFNRRYT
jgi:ABC-2 type transport system permease protein